MKCTAAYILMGVIALARPTHLHSFSGMAAAASAYSLRPVSSWYSTTAALQALSLTVEDARIQSAVDGSAFKFRGDDHYGRVADAMLHIVQSAMDAQGVQSALIGQGPGQPGSTVFYSSNVASASTVCILVQGLGAVSERGWAVIVANPNQRSVEHWDSNDKQIFSVGTPIPSSSSYAAHMETLWNDVIVEKTASSANLMFIGHSNGGRCIHELLQLRGKEVLDRTAAIALTDAIWEGKSWDGKPDVVNWIASKKPVGSTVSSSSSVDVQRSAGSTEHVYTTHTARLDFWQWLDGETTGATPQQKDEV